MGSALARRAAPALVVAAAAGAVGCGPSKPPVDPEPPVAEEPRPPSPPAPPRPSLYERLGKRQALDPIVDDFLGNVLADNRISKLFEKARKDRDRAKQLHARFVAELCVVAGGADCGYDGKSMREAHKGMNVTQAQWDAFVEDLTSAFQIHNVDDALLKELLDKLVQTTKPDIVAAGKGR